MSLRVFTWQRCARGVLLSQSRMTPVLDAPQTRGLLRRSTSESDDRAVLMITHRRRRHPARRRAQRTHLAGVRRRFLDRLGPDGTVRLAELWSRIIDGPVDVGRSAARAADAGLASASA